METTSSPTWNATPQVQLTEQAFNSSAFEVVFTLVLVIIMFGMGCAVDHEILLRNLRKPVGICVGLACQVSLMPVLTYALVKASSMSPLQSLVLILVGCCPGGSYSNIVTYWLHGDMSMSVTMTSFSNVLALGTLPGWIALYTHIENIDEALRIPFRSLAISLISMVIPIVLGILVRFKFPKASRYIPKVCGLVGIFLILGTVLSVFLVNKLELRFDANTIWPIAILPLPGMILTYAIASIPKLDLSVAARKAIAIEVAVQNAALANAVLMLSYGSRMTVVGQVVTIPFLYNIFQVAYALLLVAGYRIWLCVKGKGSNSGRKEKSSGKTSRTDGDDKELKPLSEARD